MDGLQRHNSRRSPSLVYMITFQCFSPVGYSPPHYLAPKWNSWTWVIPPHFGGRWGWGSKFHGAPGAKGARGAKKIHFFVQKIAAKRQTSLFASKLAWVGPNRGPRAPPTLVTSGFGTQGQRQHPFLTQWSLDMGDCSPSFGLHGEGIPSFYSMLSSLQNSVHSP